MTVTTNPDMLLGLSSRMGDFVNMMSNRDDLVASVSRTVDRKGNKHPAPAYFTPAHAEVCFDTAKFFDDDADAKFLDPYDSFTRINHTGFVGVAVHEAAHAAHTILNIPANTDPQVAHWLTMLEESRCEAQHLSRRPQDAVLLRGAVAQIIAPELFSGKNHSKKNDAMDIYGAAQLAVLVLARVDIGILEEDSVVEIRDDIATVLGTDILYELNMLWIEAQGTADGDVVSLLDIAARWTRLLGQNDDVPDTSEGLEGQEGVPGGSGSSSGSNSAVSSSADSTDVTEDGTVGKSQELKNPHNSSEPGNTDNSDTQEDEGTKKGMNQDAGALVDKEKVEEETDPPVAHPLPCGSWTPGDIPENPGLDSEDSESVDQSDMPDKEYTDLEKKMKNLFDQVAADARQEIEEGSAAGNSRILGKSINAKIEERERAAQTYQASTKVFTQGGVSGYYTRRIAVTNQIPDAYDKAQSRALIHALRKAQYRDVSRTLIASEAPPGRMRMSEVAKRAAQVQRGDTVTATPWKQTRRREVERPPFTLGVSIDVSGSLSHIQRPVSSMAWALSQATKHVQGNVAVAAWSDAVAPVIKPGNFPVNVPVATSGGSSSGCALSIQALDGALNLRTTEGVRMLVIVSDGCIEHKDRVQKEVDILRRSGVVVLWANVYHQKAWSPKNTQVLHVHDIKKFGVLLGTALVEALESYGR